jgi:hypothetical protein
MKPSGADPLLEHLKRELMPSTAYYVVGAPAGARDLIRFTKPLAGRYDGIPDPSPDPALLVNTVGKGKAIYFTGDLGASIHNFRIAEHMQLVENVARRLAPPPVALENAPSSVEVVLRSQADGRRWLLHLVNFTGEMTRPIRKIVPLREVRVSVAPELVLKRARTLVGRRELVVRRDAAGRATIVIPQIDEYEVVLLER